MIGESPFHRICVKGKIVSDQNLYATKKGEELPPPLSLIDDYDAAFLTVHPGANPISGKNGIGQGRLRNS
jgi:hypothetical protein